MFCKSISLLSHCGKTSKSLLKSTEETIFASPNSCVISWLVKSPLVVESIILFVFLKYHVMVQRLTAVAELLAAMSTARKGQLLLTSPAFTVQHSH